MTRLAAAEADMADPEEPLLTWGYHPAFFGPLTRDDVDGISTRRPIFVWGRSCHEFTMNSAALEKASVTQQLVAGWSESEKAQSNFAEGHFWEQGGFAVLPHIGSAVASPVKFQAGLELMRDYMHAKGVTFGNEPGGIFSKPAQDAVTRLCRRPPCPSAGHSSPTARPCARCRTTMRSSFATPRPSKAGTAA